MISFLTLLLPVLMSVCASHGSLAFSPLNNVALKSKRSLSSNADIVVHQEHYRRRDLPLYGFFDELFGGGGQGKDEDEKNTVESTNKSSPVPVVSNSQDQGGGMAIADVGVDADVDTGSMEFSEVDFRQELDKRNNVNAENEDEALEEEEEFDGYALRDAIYNKWGQCFDLEFQPGKCLYWYQSLSICMNTLLYNTGAAYSHCMRCS